jgi:hypothetical protein
MADGTLPNFDGWRFVDVPSLPPAFADRGAGAKARQMSWLDAALKGRSSTKASLVLPPELPVRRPFAGTVGGLFMAAGPFDCG